MEKKTLYQILTVSKDATQDTLKTARNELAQTFHPDNNTHLPEDRQKLIADEMAEVNKAYSVLSDSKKRKRYDETGETEPEEKLEVRAKRVLNEVYMELLSGKFTNTDWLFAYTRGSLNDKIQTAKETIDKILEQADKMNRVFKDLGSNESDNMGTETLKQLILSGLEKSKAAVEGFQTDIDVYNLALTYLEPVEK